MVRSDAWAAHSRWNSRPTLSSLTAARRASLASLEEPATTTPTSMGAASSERAPAPVEPPPPPPATPKLSPLSSLYGPDEFFLLREVVVLAAAAEVGGGGGGGSRYDWRTTAPASGYSTMMRWGRPSCARWAAVWEERALEVSEVRESRCEGDDDDVMSGVRVRSERWMDRVGCCEGRLAMTSMFLFLSLSLSRAAHRGRL